MKRLRDVSQPAPQPGPFEVMEIKMAVEGGRSVVDGVHDDGSGPELLAAPDATS
jgi:hypothetical protein